MKNSELLKCPVCYFEYSQAKYIPKLLPNCGHTLCVKCLDQILLTKPSKCPLDRKPLGSNSEQSSSFPTNLMLIQLIDEHSSSSEYDTCLFHKECRNLFCMIDKTKICPSCVHGKDDAFHHGHETKLLSELNSQAQEKSDQLKSDMVKIDKGQKEIIEMLEEKKKEAFGLKKRKFDVIRGFVDEKENQVWSELGLLFAQKKTKTEQQFQKDLTLKQQIQIHLSALNENKLDEAFFKALAKSGVKEKVSAEKEKDELDNLTKRLESELSLAEGNISKSLVSVLDKFGPDICQIKVQELETPSKKADAKLSMLSHVNSLIKVKRRGETLEILQPESGRTEGDMKNDLSQLENCEGVKSVNLNLKKQKLSEETLFALGYLWKRLQDVTEISLELINEKNKPEDYIAFFQHDFWVSQRIEKLSLCKLNSVMVTPLTEVWTESITSLVFTKIARLTDLKSLCLSFAQSDNSDQVFLAFVNQVMPCLKKLEALDLNLRSTQVTDAGIKEMCLKAKDSWQKVKSFSIDLSYSNVTMAALDALVKDAIPSFDKLEKFSLTINNFVHLDEYLLAVFWSQLKFYMKDMKSFSVDLSESDELSDYTIKEFAHQVLPVMSQLEDLKLMFVECSEITGLSIEAFAKYLPQPSNLKSFALHWGYNEITDYGLQILAKDLIRHMPKLECLELLFEYTAFGDKGVAKLWKNLVPIIENLKTFKFNFTGSEVTAACFVDFCQNTLAKMSSLTTLGIEVRPCYSVACFEIFFSVLEKLAGHIEDLQLSFEECDDIDDKTIDDFIQRIIPPMSKLRRLTLNFDETMIMWTTVEKICSVIRKMTNVGLEYAWVGYNFFESEVTNDQLELVRKNNPGFEIDLAKILYQ